MEHTILEKKMGYIEAFMLVGRFLFWCILATAPLFLAANFDRSGSFYPGRLMSSIIIQFLWAMAAIDGWFK